MSDYKDTLQLPKTDFPMKANLVNREPEILALWEKMEIYKQISQKNKGKPKFILNDGPPYANGDIHIGHALNKILKDIIVKSKHFAGFDVPFVPGWDCHGLPIELNVEKAKGKINDTFTAADFRKACRTYASEQIEKQRASFIRLGVFADWKNPYTTMGYQFEADTVRSFAKILKNGHVQTGRKPVYWCIACASALAEAEVEYADKTSPAIDVAFKVLDARFAQTQAHVIIWTTTPWTLPANRAVAVHADINYVQVQPKNNANSYILAEELLKACALRYGWEDPKILSNYTGKALAGLMLEHPFLERQVPVILGDHVTVDAGTGCVHTAPAHGQDDYLVGKQHQLEVDNPVNDRGVFFDSIPHVGGKKLQEANAILLELLAKNQKLLCSARIQHSYPHCWRHKIPLIFRATLQWFVSMEQNHLRNLALKAVEGVQWLPDWGQARMQNMLEKRPDWCVSRQRTWGVPLGLMIHKESGQVHPQMDQILEKFALEIEKNGIEIWDAWATKIAQNPAYVDYQLIPDTLDVWFESGVVHDCVLKKQADLAWPADLYIEGSDQYRGWFQTSLLTSIAIYGQAPYKQVLTHGYTVDAQGRKMSKSLGNVVAPEKVIKTLGADVLRLWVASTDYSGGDITVSDEILNRTTDAYRRIRNTLRFLLANLHDFDPAQNLIKPEQLLSLDFWVLEKTEKLQTEIIAAYAAYDFHTVVSLIQQFCIVDLGGFYLDIIKDRQYTGKLNGLPRRSAQTVLYHILKALLPLIAPVLSFTAEEAWSYLPGVSQTDQDFENSVFCQNWYEFPDLGSRKIQEPWPEILLLRGLVNKALEDARIAKVIGGSLEAKVSIYANQTWYQYLKPLEKELKFVWISSDFDLHLLETDKIPNNAHASELKELQGIWVKVDLNQAPKCERCWHRVADVNQNNTYPGLCSRCVENIETEKGETRIYA
ncbi:MAG: isoleucine--tRNA ligase [Gammaproteobacteria bacterium]